MALASLLSVGGVVVTASRTGANDCGEGHRGIAEAVADSDLVVIATVVSDTAGGTALRPEAYLKGAAIRGDLRLVDRAQTGAPCARAAIEPGMRVLAFLRGSAREVEWPRIDDGYILRDGLARSTNPLVAFQTSEAALVDEVRSSTGQYAVPAASADEGAGIGWTKTVLPVGAALLVVFAIGLVLMRLWHRIDPS